jgi:hypothetical protein
MKNKNSLASNLPSNLGKLKYILTVDKNTLQPED